MQTSRPGECGGFSLLELIIVVVLMGAVTLVALPSFVTGLRGLAVETETRDLITQMKKARSEAISRQKVFRVILSVENGKAFYSYTNEFEEELKRFNLPEDINFQLGHEVESPFRVSFYPNGRSSGAEFAVQSREGKKLKVRVDPITGFGKVVKEGDLD